MSRLVRGLFAGGRGVNLIRHITRGPWSLVKHLLRKAAHRELARLLRRLVR